jgi:hypothetical protein
LIDGHDRGPGGWVGILTGMDGGCFETHTIGHLAPGGETVG